MSVSINLQKGGNINLSKEDPSLKNVLVGLQWNERESDGVDFDLDATAFLLDASNKVTQVEDFIFYKNLRGRNDAVVHQGDNRTGQGNGDDEKIKVFLGKLPAEIQRILIAVTIHEAAERGQNFGQVDGACIRIVNDEKAEAHLQQVQFNGVEFDERIGEITRFDLTENASTETAMIFGELYRAGSDWKFKAVGQGYAGGLQKLLDLFVNIP